jgi:hypothetical protein
MTIPSAGSRKIRIGNDDFRWRVCDRATYCQGIAVSNLTVAIESSPRGQTLHLTLPALRCDNRLFHPGYVVSPADVARWIPLAIDRGWEPNQSGPTFQLKLTEADLESQHLHQPTME